MKDAEFHIENRENFHRERVHFKKWDK